MLHAGLDLGRRRLGYCLLDGQGEREEVAAAAPADNKGRYKFPYGDFEKVHRCGLNGAVVAWVVGGDRALVRVGSLLSYHA